MSISRRLSPRRRLPIEAFESRAQVFSAVVVAIDCEVEFFGGGMIASRRRGTRCLPDQRVLHHSPRNAQHARGVLHGTFGDGALS